MSRTGVFGPVPPPVTTATMPSTPKMLFVSSILAVVIFVEKYLTKFCVQVVALVQQDDIFAWAGDSSLMFFVKLPELA